MEMTTVAGSNSKTIECHYYQTQALQAKARFVALIAGTGGGKCLAIDSQVLLANGQLVSINQIKQGDEILRLNDELKITPSKVTASFSVGEKPLYKVATRTGRTLKVTAEHPLYGINGWTPASKFSAGDFIGVPRRYPATGINREDYSKLRILGYLLGDGGTTHGISFSNIDSIILDDLRKCLPRPCKLAHRSKCDYSIIGYGQGCSSTHPVRDWCKEWGILGKKSKEKRIPAYIFNLTNECIAEMLRAYFACDGWIDNRGFGVASASEGLIDDVQHLLLRFGIISRTRYKPVGKFHSWALAVRAYNDLIKLADSIQIISKYKKLSTLLSSRKYSGGGIDSIPNFPRADCVVALGSPLPSKRGGYRDRRGHRLLRFTRKTLVSRDKAEELARHFQIGEREAFSDIYWDSIKSITPIGTQPVWDLTVEDGQNFIANDIFAHNTYTGPMWMYQELEKYPTDEFLVIAPTYKMLTRATVPTMVEIFRDTTAEGILKQSHGVYITPQGGKIWLGSADRPESLEAGQYRGAWMDEAGQMKYQAWYVVQARLGVKQGRALMTTTPYAVNWLYYEVYKRWLDGDKDYDVIQFASINNPYYPQAEFDRAKKTLSTELFEMRYGGQFRKMEGLIYPEFRTDHVIDSFTLPEDWKNLGWRKIGGIDFGYNNPFVALKGAVSPDDVLYIYDEYFKANTLLEEHAKKIADIDIRYEADPSGKREIMELKHKGVRLRSANNEVNPGIDAVRARIRTQRLRVTKSCRNLIDEFETYAWMEDKDKPQKERDHGLDALRYMVIGHDGRLAKPRIRRI